jgi:hypothetical protein
MYLNDLLKLYASANKQGVHSNSIENMFGKTIQKAIEPFPPFTFQFLSLNLMLLISF